MSLSFGLHAQDAQGDLAANLEPNSQAAPLNAPSNPMLTAETGNVGNNLSESDDSQAISQDQSALSDLDPEAGVVPSVVRLPEADVQKNIFDASAVSNFSYIDLFGEAGPNFEPAFEIVKTKPSPNAMVKSEDDTPAIYTEMDKLLKAADESSELGNLSAEEKRAISQVYRKREGELVFVTDENKEASYKSAFAQVGAQGLPSSRYDFGIPKFTDPIKEFAAQEIARSAFIIRYGTDMERGIVKPNDLGSEYDLVPEGRSARNLLNDFVASNDANKFIADLEPNDPDYPALKEALAKMRGVEPESQTADLEEVPEGNVLRLGVKSDAVGLLRKRLQALDLLDDADLQTILSDVEGGAPSPDAPENIFDQGLMEAVQAFQSQAGLTADGVAGPTTLRHINGKSDAKGNPKSILIAMERHRWEPQDRAGRQIFVNLPAFMAEVRDDNVKTFETRVVIGKNDPKYRTPEFHDLMENVVINPKWNVPNSIAVEEFLPRLKAGKRLGSSMQIISRKTGKPVDPSTINFSKYTGKTFPYLIQQKSGDGNALGNVKFIFPNSHNIYLHDTPSKGLFANSSRAYSHGCVRVGDPADLAAHLLAPYYSDPSASYDKIVATKKETYVELKTKVPVFLTYFTTFVNDDGQIAHVPDIYGRDPALAKALKAVGVDV